MAEQQAEPQFRTYSHDALGFERIIVYNSGEVNAPQQPRLRCFTLLGRETPDSPFVTKFLEQIAIDAARARMIEALLRTVPAVSRGALYSAYHNRTPEAETETEALLAEFRGEAEYLERLIDQINMRLYPFRLRVVPVGGTHYVLQAIEEGEPTP